MAMSAKAVTARPLGSIEVPRASLETWLTARPNITLSRDDQPISVNRMTVKTISATPPKPKTLRSTVYCSTP